VSGTDDESSTPSCDEAINSSISESDKLGRGVPKKKSDERVRITIQQKMQAAQHFQANKGMTQAALIEWCFHKFEMKNPVHGDQTSLSGGRCHCGEGEIDSRTNQSELESLSSLDSQFQTSTSK
jgi:hypothetical protein